MTAAEPLSRILKGDREPISTRPPTPQPAPRPQLPDQNEDDAASGPEWQKIPDTTRDLSAALPDSVALLKVVPVRVDNQDCFQLELYWRHRILVTDDLKELKRQGRPGFVLADELDHRISPRNAVDSYTKLRAWSETKYELTKWLTVLRRNPDLRLIVWDDTDFGIPWELFWHAMGQDSAWLGTAVQVIRWTTVHDANRHDQFSAEESQSVGGDILYYEDPKLTADATTIHHPRDHPGYSAACSMEDLLDKLTKPGNYGLVYVRGHGRHDPDVFKSTLAGVRLADLSGRNLPALAGSKSMVFLNACNSARPVIDKSLGDECNRNFAEVFLRQRAGGVVASMAEVPIYHSAAMARDLVHEARGPDGVPIPEFLRAHRERYAKKLPVHTSDTNLTNLQQRMILAFLHASVFAYFGHPDSVFRLASPKEVKP
jgi:hypothetical protein